MKSPSIVKGHVESMPVHTCLFCNSKVLVNSSEKVFDTRFGIEGWYEICRCAGCGLEQTIPRPLPEELKKLYETYYNFGGEKNTTYTRLRERFLSSGLYRFWLAVDGDISFHKVKGSGRLLDIGCNEGRGLKIYEQNGFEAEGLELNEAAAAVARAHSFTVHTELVEQFQPTNLYDVCVLSNVLEHSLDPGEMLFHVRRLLKPNGQVWISCPNNRSWLRWLFGRFWINWHVPFHIVHFSSRTLIRLLRETGFNVTEIRNITPSLWVTHSIISWVFAKRGKPTKQLRDPLMVVFLMLAVRIFSFPWLWLGNRMGRGDSLIVVARKI